MTTLSPTKARANLTAWLKKAAAGEDIGILYGDKVIALRPVEVESTDYAEREYGVTKDELKNFTERMDAKIKKNRKAGKYKIYNGNIEDLVKD
jgi:antitoxin (DNA-binding transcriptional repressor) of toxin-antitoxin stability system